MQEVGGNIPAFNKAIRDLYTKANGTESMLLVRTILKPSTIEGNGLFAGERISAGQVIWEFTPGLDATFPRASLKALPPVVQDFLNRYCSLDGTSENLTIYADDARFINHSQQANTLWDEGAEVLVAARDIEAGEEITENYYVVEWDGLDSIGRRFG
jgi:uncharacterized protein